MVAARVVGHAAMGSKPRGLAAWSQAVGTYLPYQVCTVITYVTRDGDVEDGPGLCNDGDVLSCESRASVVRTRWTTGHMFLHRQ